MESKAVRDVKARTASGVQVMARLLGLNFNHRLAAVSAALRANPVRDMIFAAVLANNEVVERECIVGASAIAAALRDFPLRKGTHRDSPVDNTYTKWIALWAIAKRYYKDVS